MKINRFVTICLLLLSVSLAIVAQSRDYTFRTFSPDGGFYYDGVKDIEQDRDGFMWIMMDYDLFRFDGYQYKHYYSHFSEWEKAVDWNFNDMVVDKHNNFYIATNNGLYRYVKHSDSFERLIDNKIENVDVDARDNIWVKINSQLGIFNPENKTVVYPQCDGKLHTFYRKMIPTDTQELYILNNTGKVFRYDYAKQEIVPCHAQKTAIENIGYIIDAEIDKGKLWVLIKDKGLFKVDLSVFDVEEQYNDFLKEDNHIRTLLIDKNSSIWIGTMNGMFVMDKDAKKFKHFKHQQGDKSTLPNNSIWTINEDWQNNIWIGTYSGGLYYVNINEASPFTTYVSQVNQLNHLPVSSFAENDAYLWVGTEGGGINRLNKQTNKFDYLIHDKNKNSIAHNNVKSLVLDPQENLWIGTYIGGIDCYNTKTGHFTNFGYKKEDNENSLLSNNIRKLVEDGTSGIWITYQLKNTTVSYLSYSDRSIKHYPLGDTNKEHYVFDMLCDNNNNLWLLTHQKLIKMDIKTHQYQEVVLDNSLTLNGQSFCIDALGNLWIGTIGKGLLEYNTHTGAYTKHREILDYDVSSIYGICYDGDGQLWLGTNNGLFEYDIVNKKYSRYDKNDGTQGLMYYPLSVYKGRNEKIYFGGTNGFTSIDKANIASNEYKPNVFLTDFMVDNLPVDSLSSFIGKNNELVLDYDQMNFGFKFSSDNYLMPEKNKFKYRLVGYDDKWISVDASNRYVSYSKVPAGRYTFEILAANNDGVWNEVATKIEIRRKAAPWFSWFAYVIYLLLIVGLLYIIYYYYTEKKNLKLRLYLDGIEKNKRDEIHESQLLFFTNISHDFRTPLSLIIGVVDKLRREGLKEYYYRILNGNSQRLLNLVNELMDFRAVENGKMALEVEDMNVNEFVKEIASSFDNYAIQSKINFEIKPDPNLPSSLYVDKYVMEKVLMNLLNNAFKYTEKKGTVVLETHLMHQTFASKFENSFIVNNDVRYKNYFSIVIRDTGVGITKESIASVFERFYKVRTVNFDSHLGTGIGLALVKSLTLLHKGFITIYSQRDKGTDIQVCFPIEKSVYLLDEIKTFATIDVDIDVDEIDEERVDQTYTLPDEKSEGLMKSNKYKILLAEDNEDLRTLIKDALSKTYDVIEAENGEEASKLLVNNEIDLILSDIMMPVKDGITFCGEVKNNIETSHIPFIMLSAKTSVESKIEGADSGADIYFEKPLDFDLLKLSLDNIFKQRELLREHYAKNYFAESSELSMNEKDNEFLKEFIQIIEENIDKSDLDVNYIASQLSMSRSKLYNKTKGITGKSIVEFILNYRLRKAARLIIEEDMTMREVMVHIGIESQPYFTNAFKKEFGKTPTQFASENKR